MRYEFATMRASRFLLNDPSPTSELMRVLLLIPSQRTNPQACSGYLCPLASNVEAVPINAVSWNTRQAAVAQQLKFLMDTRYHHPCR